MPIGRPLKFKSPEEITEKAEAYFAKCLKNREPILVTGLCLELDTTRETLMDYEDDRGQDFSDAVKKAKLKCAQYAENQMYTGKNGAAGPIFALKNFGWRDERSIDHSNKGEKFESIDAKSLALIAKYEAELKKKTLE